MQQTNPAHVLIVDDVFDIRNYFGTLLHRQHYRVSAAASGAEAFAVIAEDCPDLIILDHYLPDTSGEEILGRLRAETRTFETPVIFLSVDSSMARFRAVMELGADDFLAKPAQPHDLSDAVAAQLAKWRQRARRRNTARGHAAPVAAQPGSGVPPGYVVSATLGKGGTATAYLARRAGDAEDCVLKVLSPAGAAEPDVAARFALEGRLLARIAHPNVVRVFDHGTTGGHAYLAMELVAGGTLKQMLGHPWESFEALRLMQKLARALEAVHAAGVVHRDLKPDNIMLRNNSLEPVLLDFGAARDLRGDDGRNADGSIMGTPSYMAPEIIGGAQAMPASDVYACGVVLYELLTGSRPYVGGNATQVMEQHLRFPVPQLPRRQAVFQPLLRRLLAKDQNDRPRDGAQLAAELDTLWREMNGAAPPASQRGDAA